MLLKEGQPNPPPDTGGAIKTVYLLLNSDKSVNYLNRLSDQLYRKGSLIGDWFFKENLPVEDQRFFANNVGANSFATLDNVKALKAASSDKASFEYEDLTELQFPGTIYKNFPDNTWTWTGHDVTSVEIFTPTSSDPDKGPLYITANLSQDVSNTRILTPISFDDQRALPILVTGSVSIMTYIELSED